MPTIARVLTIYHDDCEQRGVLTVERSRIRAALHLLPAFGRLRVDRLRLAHVKRYIERRGERGAKAGTIARELVILRAALRYGWKRQLYRHYPYVPVPAGGGRRKRTLSQTEAGRLLRAAGAEGLHVLLFTAIALYTGARASAVLDLTWDRADASLLDFRVPGDSPRRKHRAQVPPPPQLSRLLAAARKRSKGPWVVERHDKRVPHISRPFAAACARAGLQGVTPHTLRHTCATWLAEASVPMDVIAMWLGHLDPQITRAVYAHVHPSYLAGAARVLAGLRVVIPQL